MKMASSRLREPTPVCRSSQIGARLAPPGLRGETARDDRSPRRPQEARSPATPPLPPPALTGLLGARKPRLGSLRTPSANEFHQEETLSPETSGVAR